MATSKPEGQTVFVQNISESVTAKTLGDFFGFCGEIKSLELKRVAGGPTQVAAVVFATPAAATTAQLLTNALIVDRAITVRPFGPEDETIFSPIPDTTPTPTSVSTSSAPESAPIVAPQPVTETTGAMITKAEAEAEAEAEGEGEGEGEGGEKVQLLKATKDDLKKRDYGNVPDSERTKTSVVASLIASGYILGEDTFRAAVEYDTRHQLSKQLLDTAANIDNALNITSSVGKATAYVTEALRNIDASLDISGKVATAANRVSVAVETAAAAAEVDAARLAQNQYVSGVVDAFRVIGDALNETMTTLHKESVAEIAARHQQREIEAASQTEMAIVSTTTTTTTTTTSETPETPPREERLSADIVALNDDNKDKDDEDDEDEGDIQVKMNATNNNNNNNNNNTDQIPPAIPPK